MERVLLYQDLTDAEFARTVEQHVAALNKALEGIAARARAPARAAGATGKGRTITTCDMEVLLPALYDAKVGALGLEFANPRRQHEVGGARQANPCPMTWC